MTTAKEHIKEFVESSVEYPYGSFQDSGPFISDEARRVIEIVFYGFICFTVSVVGSAANIINIIIFIKQGFKDSVNVGLCGLSISDMFLLLSSAWTSICYNPMFQYSDIIFENEKILSITAGWPSLCFISTTSWITAFITFERCVCIALPMKVKGIITPKRTCITLLVIFLVMLASICPGLCSANVVTSFNLERNKTLLTLSFVYNGIALRSVTHNINIFSEFCSCIILVVCTVILIYKLQVKSQWRHKTGAISSLATTDSISSRDKRVIKMVISISCIFVVCYFPGILNMIMRVVFAEDYSYHGRYQNIVISTWAIFDTLNSVNSSINILVYYNMSSKFRMNFRKLFSADDSVH